MQIRIGGLEIGRADGPLGPVGVSDFDPSYPEIRSSDNPREARDGVIPGRDYLGSRRLSFDVWTNRQSMKEARDTIGEVLRVWRDQRTRLVSGALVPLDYRATDDPRWKRVYGRPRRADDPDFGVLMRGGRAESSLEFEVFDPLVYDEALQEVTLRVVEGSTAGDSWIPPWTWPVVPSAGTTERRPGALQIDGQERTPVMVEFHGPGSRFSIDGSRGWHVGLKPNVTLAYDESIFIDPLTRTVTDNFGNDRSGTLDRRTYLTDVGLAPGMENVFFSAVDPSHRAYTVISWRPAYASLA